MSVSRHVMAAKVTEWLRNKAGAGVALSPSARCDLRDIIRYISLDNPEKALEFGRFLVAKTRALGRFPEMGREVPETGNSSIREIIVRSYRVVYRVESSKRMVQVIRFWHAARGMPQIKT